MENHNFDNNRTYTFKPALSVGIMAVISTISDIIYFLEMRELLDDGCADGLHNFVLSRSWIGLSFAFIMLFNFILVLAMRCRSGLILIDSAFLANIFAIGNVCLLSAFLNSNPCVVKVTKLYNLAFILVSHLMMIVVLVLARMQGSEDSFFIVYSKLRSWLFQPQELYVREDLEA